ncbi:MAG: hypothetical protein M3O76_06055 [Actinomycetota bacterium]|nr:hypothetical protein [Actinomycetota bacterium]
MAVIERAGPYVEQLFENEDVRADLQRAAARARQAYAGVRSKKNTKKVLTDSRVRRRLGQSVGAARNAVVAIKRGPKEKKRKRRRGRLLIFVVLAGALFLAVNEDVRNRILGLLIGIGRPDASAKPSEAHGASSAPEPVDPGKSSA